MIFLRRETTLGIRNIMNLNKKWYHDSIKHYIKQQRFNNNINNFRNNKPGHTKPSQQRTLTSNNKKQSMIEWWLSEKEIPPRYTLSWYFEMLLICTVFGITGTSTMVVVRPAVSNILGLKGTFKDGPWSYRICSLVIMTPVYATLLVCVGTVFGRHVYFRHFAVKMFSRFGVPPESMDKSFVERSKTFRKW